MKRKITINKGANGALNGRLSIPINLLREIGITENDRDVYINLESNKLVIEKVGNRKIDLPRKISVEITRDESDYLLR